MATGGFLTSTRPRSGLRNRLLDPVYSGESRLCRCDRRNAGNAGYAQKRITARSVDFHIADAYALFWRILVLASAAPLASVVFSIICMRGWSLEPCDLDSPHHEGSKRPVTL